MAFRAIAKGALFLLGFSTMLVSTLDVGRAQPDIAQGADDQLMQIFNFIFTGDVTGKQPDAFTPNQVLTISITDRPNCIVEVRKPSEKVIYYFNNVYRNRSRLEKAGVYTQIHLYGDPITIAGIDTQLKQEYRMIMVKAFTDEVDRALALLYKDYCKLKEPPF